MKKKNLLWISALLLMLTGCSSDDDTSNADNVNPNFIVGEWMASHHSKTPNSADTADMWDFTFNADGTGKGHIGTGSFRYEINGNRITLLLTNIESYYGRTEFEYEIVSFSEDRMEWDEISNEDEGYYGQYLKFYRK